MSATIPTLALPFYTIRTRLDDSDFTLQFRYSDRASRYFLNIYDVKDVLLVAGLKLVPGVLLLQYYAHVPGMPPGELMVIALGSDGSPPKLGEIGVGLRCTLTYFTQAEVKANRAASAAAKGV
jgi:hypothetical protein